MNMSIALIFIAVAWYSGICISSEIYIAKAQSAYDAKDWRALRIYADKGYSSIVPLEPRYSLPVINYTGLAYFQWDKDKEKALECFVKANRQHPNQIMVINNIGSIYGAMGNYDQSAAYYRQTLQIFPHYEFGLLNLARAYYLDKKYDLAYQAILSCDPRTKNNEVNLLRIQIEKVLND